MTAPARKPDDIMAEYLLSGAKMLAEICPACNAPLFEVHGKKLCVVCAENAPTQPAAPAPAAAPGPKPAPVPENVRVIMPQYARPQSTDAPVPDDIPAVLDTLILRFARRAEEEPDPARCLTYMECIRTAAESRVILRR